MPKRPKPKFNRSPAVKKMARQLIEPDAVAPILFINIWEGASGQWHFDLVNGAGEKWIVGGPGTQNKIVAMAVKFQEFSHLPIYMEGERFDGLKPSLMKGRPE